MTVARMDQTHLKLVGRLENDIQQIQTRNDYQSTDYAIIFKLPYLMGFMYYYIYFLIYIGFDCNSDCGKYLTINVMDSLIK